MKRLLILAGVLVALAAALPVQAAVAAPSGLSATATPAVGKPGTFVHVVGTGWPVGAHVQMVTCGQLALGGTSDCDITVADTTVANPQGAFAADVVLGRPPAPCPCVINVTAPESPTPVNIPVEVVGMATRAPRLPSTVSPDRLRVVSTSVRGWGPWTALFGASAHRTVVVKVQNTADAAADGVRLRLYSGSVDRSSGTGGDELAAVTIDRVAAGEVRSVEVPITLAPGLGGRVAVHGELAGVTAFTVSTSSHAWGFFVLDALLLVVFVAVVVRRIRARERPQAGRHAQPRVKATV